MINQWKIHENLYGNKKQREKDSGNSCFHEKIEGFAVKEKRGRRFSRLALIGSIRIRSFGSRKMNSKAEISGVSRDYLVQKVDTFLERESERALFSKLNQTPSVSCFCLCFFLPSSMLSGHSGKAKDHRF